jgi:hypothetical protein
MEAASIISSYKEKERTLLLLLLLLGSLSWIQAHQRVEELQNLYAL